MIAIIDYKMGNTASVANALRFLGEEVVLTNKKEQIEQAERIILPGVGSFQAAMAEINHLDLKNILYQEVVMRKKPYLGICLGLQLLAETGSEYGTTEGLGFVKGQVIKLQTSNVLPHVGWNEVKVNPDNQVLFKDTTKRNFYFVHSYHLTTSEDIVSSTCNYGQEFISSIQKKNIFGTQFHPEKSQSEGLTILKNFLCYKNA